MEAEDLIDTQFIAENVGFLDNCFDNSFVLQNSRTALQAYSLEEECRSSTKASQRNKKRKSTSIISSTIQEATSKVETLTQCQVNETSEKRYLKNWGLPHEIVLKYEEKGIKEMFDWQVSCLANLKVLLECSNLVYSAPTSAGKTLVAEILTIKTVLERQKKVLIILPFVSIVREKTYYLQDILSSSGVKVEGFVGSQSPPGGLQAVHIAICTIEKANSLVNRLLDDGNISELGAVIVDELHLLGDPHRGYILELLLTKIKYITSMQDNTTIQIVGMSATLPNLEVLADWLNAELFVTQFRPIPLDEYCLVGNQYYNKHGHCVNIEKDFNIAAIDNDIVLKICLSTIKEGCSVLIFCMTKNRCETLAQNLASSFHQIGCSGNEVGTILRQQLNSEKISEVLEQLQNSPVGLDSILRNTISFGVAYHHAGLTFDERDIIEGAFKSGAIRVLVATSTLSSGVNLPARKVIIRTPVFQRQPINILTYKQMIGRAGRMGKDLKGESILICTDAEKRIGFELMFGALNPVHSCIESEDKFMRAILEVIASQDLCTETELEIYSKCTLLFVQETGVNAPNSLLDKTLKSLIGCELVRQQKDGDETQYVATPLGKACLSSSMAPHDGISMFCELQKARQCLVLETDLHLIYLVTPYSVSSQWGDIDWLHLLTLWESLTRSMKKVGELVGVQESFIVRSLRGVNKSNVNVNRLHIHKRFYTALALQDLVNEVPLAEVAAKFQCARGFLQSLQQAAATFAGMVTAFCRQLGWKNIEMLISQFQDRLHFGIHSELLELMKLPTLNGKRARALYDLGFETVYSVASADVNSIENALLKAIPFQSDKEMEDDDNDDVRKRKKIKNIWITGCCGITTKEAAKNLIIEARKYLEYEIGAAAIKWNNNILHNDDEKQSKGNEVQDNKSLITKADSSIIVKEEKESHVCPFPLQSKEQTTECSNINLETVGTIQTNLNTPYGSCTTNESRCGLSILQSSSPIVVENSQWDSLNFTEGVIENITKGRISDNIFSTNISLSDDEVKDYRTVTEISTQSKNASVKDESLFSSEADSMFEESLPVDLIPSKLLQDKDVKIQTAVAKESQMPNVQEIENSESIANAFKSSLIEFTDDEDEDIKLVYEEDNRLSENEFDTGFNVSQDEICSQEIVMSPLKNSFKSPCKRTSDPSDAQQPSAKKSRLSKQLIPEDNQNNTAGLKVKTIDILLKNHTIKSLILKNRDIAKNMDHIINLKDAIICVKINSAVLNARIGKNIFLKSKLLESEVVKSDELISLCICDNDGTCIVLDMNSVSGDDKANTMSKLASWFSSKETKLKVLSLKSTFLKLRKLGLELNDCEDISLSEWLIDSNEKVPTMFYLIKKYGDIDLSVAPIKVNARVKKFSTLDQFETLCVSAWCLRYVSDKQRSVLSAQYDNYQDVMKTELQVQRILLDSEYEGVSVDKELVSKLLVEARSTQELLQKKAYSLCGYRFNLNSSQEVAKALGLHGGRRVRTDKCALESLDSPLAEVVVYWRKLNYILTHTLYPLTEKACIYTEGDRLKPSYTMFTCTGRVSMHEPNLQNVPRTFSIPLRCLSEPRGGEPGGAVEFNCRGVVRAAPGCLLVGADYCQLELRVLAHFSGDRALAALLTAPGDVFVALAAAWTGLPADQVGEEVRARTKAAVYALVYGMGAAALARRLGAAGAAAAALQAALLRACPALPAAAAALVARCRRARAAATLLQRRRPLPDIDSALPAKRSAAERRAVNTAVQGSAADVAKAAMCRVRELARHLRPRLLLQLHDELVYEVRAGAAPEFARLLRLAMEGAAALAVPLPVRVKAGPTWGAMQPLPP